MHPANMAEFFLWCSVINTGLMLFWTVILWLAPNWIYSTQKSFLTIPREQFQTVFYCLIGFFKVMIIIFNWTPYFALRIIG